LRKLSLFLLILIILIFSACSKELDSTESLNKEIADLNSKVSVLTEENNKLKNDLEQLDNQQKTESPDETINNTESSSSVSTITTTPIGQFTKLYLIHSECNPYITIVHICFRSFFHRKDGSQRHVACFIDLTLHTFR
jgi:regulator of replication initiation timing